MIKTVLYSLAIAVFSFPGWTGRQTTGYYSTIYHSLQTRSNAGSASGLAKNLSGPHAPGSMRVNSRPAKSENFILFLFDVSGSMNDNNKMAKAKQAAISSLQYIWLQARSNNLVPSIGIMVFSGECVPDPTKKVLDFTSDTVKIKLAIMKQLPPPHGNTPTPKAIENADLFLRQRLKAGGDCEGTLVIMTDGQSTCGSLRPAGTYSEAKANKIFTPCDMGGDYALRYQTIGFDIKPGSDAENDLKYISSTHNGKYFQANDAEDLKKAIEKVVRFFVPIEKQQSSTRMKQDNITDFKAAVNLINTNNYDTALSSCKILLEKFPDDSAVMYNYGLMCEANEQYKGAVAAYEKYLRLNPFVPTKRVLEETIRKLRSYLPDQFSYQKQVVGSDISFLDAYMKKLSSGETIPQANEFTGFIKEKSAFYETLPITLGVDEPKVQDMSRALVIAFKNAQRRAASNNAWDQSAVPVVSTIHSRLIRLSELINELQLR